MTNAALAYHAGRIRPVHAAARPINNAAHLKSKRQEALLRFFQAKETLINKTFVARM